ncbi:DnaA regulatory inactivator Hda [Luteimonas aestuarii]|uniref:DnaA regulatory inactivator Hda n=1 Tax=Luteimonas aestuarii TaxID=453837 RepID=A0A4R5U1G4_9GAMM|nr:DnaA regulatory inactivator Hda [Luteimonas aestuarii]TDK27429.1 DnaA regulatory inactivator Hda [Luteimonas aestuarii]
MVTPVPQLPLALRYPPDQRFDTFVSGDPTVPAHLRAAVDGSHPGSLFIAGAAGTGKTHLLLAACAEADGTGRRAAYLPLASAVGRLRDALEAMHANELVALDGVDAIAGRRDDEVALFDLHNRVHDAGGTMLYAARDIPDALPLALPDLRSRWQQCARITLPVLGDAARREVLRLRATRRGLQVDDAALDWLLRRVDRDLGSLTQLFDQLDRAALAAQRRITVPFLRRFFEGN